MNGGWGDDSNGGIATPLIPPLDPPLGPTTPNMTNANVEVPIYCCSYLFFLIYYILLWLIPDF